MLRVISKERILKEMAEQHSDWPNGERPKWRFADGFDLRKVTKPGEGNVIAEFIGTGNFASAWNERRQYEVDAGRDQEPLLYQSIYETIEDATLPEHVTIYKIGPGGVVLEEVKEGGEVKFASISSSAEALQLKQYGVGLEYSKQLRIYNRLWDVAIVERQVGIANNALLNHLHLYPIISYGYAAANQTAASSTGSTLVEKYLRTIEDAIVNSKTDTSNPRRGPYDLLVSTNDMFMVERALRRVPQEGVELQSSAIDMIQNVIAYDGWTGTRGKKSTTYTGVSSGTAYLISKQFKMQDFTSWMKQSLMMTMGNPDVSRFIEAQMVWDVILGVYSNPLRGVEEITWPTS